MENRYEFTAALRTIADRLDMMTDAELGNTNLLISIWPTTKEEFMAMMKIIPSLFEVEQDDHDVTVKKRFGCNEIYMKIGRQTVCKLIKPAQPAVYDCEPFIYPEPEKGGE